ncbi:MULTISPECIES: NAD(P)-dependent oxidoreductase [unclassified Paenibacillus]|uniref:precorrin-2 dehydrogenase/sirohydrochlorin ferrochelatase family protein n=1 Tax=unclassified Paenibacillus TaxID=185978 RepID=UPI002405D2FA|nr:MULTISPECIES: NAD(P)-dependent oxidoreductase [unclassified Paenibacillus]MDF9844026.1 precorrin-2 dehydrogenase/sirohydrochlorin ferrochelatase [Paenibacillus sp. PastF-2]MDF9850631.1 precorrin-2 dehydrogenase/sirohydrochlorin ferrochelatase [Paenibacillus sp. PastM-2]MDF9857219.1 precorrin-2 dehydrogenase/sirohydrochlorin ferrochelatase [Paenibacillus sp. PastF-1]MDH6482481.1 precorrin-2 dehydrogenase/sirohydrochlorin ferrochelatase [Paenibacillus sp. PastH-2]MDH6509916.1 precorrin-2 dehy
MAGYLPVMLDVSGQRIVVIGGGAVAERKVLSLLEAEAAVVIISPELTAVLSGLAGEGRIQWVNRGYEAGDVRGAFLVYAASSDPAVNEAAAAEAKALGLPVNVASHAEAGNFITPGVLRRGRLTVAVSTSGAGPSAAAEITAQLAEVLGEEYEPYLDFLHMMRSEIKRQEASAEVRRRLLRQLGQLDVLNQLRQGTFIEWTPEAVLAWIAANREE